MTEKTGKLKEYFDLMIVVPLEEEHDILQEVFEYKGDFSDGQYIITEYSVPGSELRVASILQPEMGKAAAGETARYADEHFGIGVFVIFGIAGSLNDDNKIGDVCYAGELIDIQNNASTFDDSSENFPMSFAPHSYSTASHLIQSAKFLRNHPFTKHHFRKWQEGCADQRRKFIEALSVRPETL